MANDVKFEGKERRMPKIEKCLAEYGLASLEEARDLCLSKGIDVDKIVKGVQPIAFENASWAYTPGCAVALKKGCNSAVHRHWPAGVLCSGFRCGEPQGRPGPRQPGRPSAPRRDQVLCVPRRPRVLRCRRRRNRHCQDSEPRPQRAAPHHPERPGQGRCLHHLQNQRLHLCEDRLRLLQRRAEDCRREGVLRRRARSG